MLGTIDGALPLCRSAPDNVEALTTIRRGFHTLKGSGRMVGLGDLGEVAWQIEQMMNRWLEMKQPATPGLLELIAKASSAFSGWIEELRAGRQPLIEAKDIVEHAARLKAGETSPPASAEASAQEVSVGEVRLSRS